MPEFSFTNGTGKTVKLSSSIQCGHTVWVREEAQLGGPASSL